MSIWYYSELGRVMGCGESDKEGTYSVQKVDKEQKRSLSVSRWDLDHIDIHDSHLSILKPSNGDDDIENIAYYEVPYAQSNSIGGWHILYSESEDASKLDVERMSKSSGGHIDNLDYYYYSTKIDREREKWDRYTITKTNRGIPSKRETKKRINNTKFSDIIFLFNRLHGHIYNSLIARSRSEYSIYIDSILWSMEKIDHQMQYKDRIGVWDNLSESAFISFDLRPRYCHG